VGKLEHLCITGPATVENSMAVAKQKISWFTICSSNSASEYIQKKELKAGTQANICIPMFTVVKRLKTT
jgi:hypothetical protein